MIVDDEDAYVGDTEWISFGIYEIGLFSMLTYFGEGIFILLMFDNLTFLKEYSIFKKMGYLLVRESINSI